MNKKQPRFYYKGNQLKQLRAFCAVAKSGKMTDAAEELYLSQPAISLQVRALERELDTVLFERHGPRINLTREGQELYELAQPLVESLETLNARFNRRMKGDLDSGEVVIAAGESTIIYLLPRLVQHFRKRYPNIHVQLKNVTGRDGLAMIRDDEVDFAIGSMLDVPSDIDYQPIYSYEPALILPLSHDLADYDDVKIEDISPYGLILPPRRLTTWRMVDRVFQQHQVPFNVTLEVGGWEVIKRYVELDFGVSIVTGICLRKQDKLVAKNMSAYFPKRSYGTVMRRGKFLSPQANAFLEVTEESSIPNSPWRVGESRPG
ncbi:MAG: LysR family transcriptional regulator [Lysobacterales bacterium]